MTKEEKNAAATVAATLLGVVAMLIASFLGCEM
jgi:hypothetical protein